MEDGRGARTSAASAILHRRERGEQLVRLKRLANPVKKKNEKNEADGDPRFPEHAGVGGHDRPAVAAGGDPAPGAGATTRLTGLVSPLSLSQEAVFPAAPRRPSLQP